MFNYRKAVIQDIPEIKELMDLSISKVLGKLTDKKGLEASYESMGLDTKLIEDNSHNSDIEMIKTAMNFS